MSDEQRGGIRSSSFIIIQHSQLTQCITSPLVRRSASPGTQSCCGEDMSWSEVTLEEASQSTNVSRTYGQGRFAGEEIQGCEENKEEEEEDDDLSAWVQLPSVDQTMIGSPNPESGVASTQPVVSLSTLIRSADETLAGCPLGCRYSTVRAAILSSATRRIALHGILRSGRRTLIDSTTTTPICTPLFRDRSKLPDYRCRCCYGCCC